MSEWISVNEKLPKEFEDVILTDGKKSFEGFLFRDYDYDSDRSVFPAWRVSSSGRIVSATHWMPLPEPPSGE